jgi:HK97 gp10 family phage protein
VAAGGRGIVVRINQAAIDQLATTDQGPVARAMQACGEIVAQGAKLRAPVSPHGSNGRPSGYLRSQIGWELVVEDVVKARVATPALSVDGAPYGLFQEIGTRKMAAQPHLRPALDDLAGKTL